MTPDEYDALDAKRRSEAKGARPAIEAEQRRQRDLRVAELLRQAEEARRSEAWLEPISFGEDHPLLGVAAAMAERLSEMQPRRCGEKIYLARWVDGVTFRPSPGKFPGAWSVELSFRDWREAGSGGVEFYTSSDELAEVWCLP